MRGQYRNFQGLQNNFEEQLFLALKQSFELEWLYADNGLGVFDTHRTKLTFSKKPDGDDVNENSFQINKNQILHAKNDGNLNVILVHNRMVGIEGSRRSFLK